MCPPVRAAARFAISYRSEQESDRELLAALHASTRGARFAGLGLPEAALAALLEQQLDAQERHYRAVYPAAKRLIIERNGSAIGRLAFASGEANLHLIDVALLPDRRGVGLGSAIIADLVEHADELTLPVSLHVEQDNPALRLYERLGFRAVDAQPPYLLMERLRA